MQVEVNQPVDASDEPVEAYVLPAATKSSTRPGDYYFLTDVLFE